MKNQKNNKIENLKHTKGEWKTNSHPFLHVEVENQWICQLSDIKMEGFHSILSGEWDKENERVSEIKLANAKLIAAAPQLLEALQTLLKEARANSFELNYSINDTPAEQKAAEVIKQATE